MRKGFSLLEVMVSVVILSSITGAAIEIFRLGYRAAAESQNRTIAYNLAREKLEQYSGIPLNYSGSSEGYGAIANFLNFRRVVNVNYYAYGSYLIQITVTVYWNNDRNSQSFTTLKASY